MPIDDQKSIRAYTVAELAELGTLGGRTTIYALVKAGQLRSLKIGKLRRIPHDAVLECAKRFEV